MTASDLEAAVAAAYGAIGHALSEEDRHAIRFWNFIPAIHADMGGARDRYMVFNAGRFDAFASWFGSPQAFSRALPTASAVGIRRGPLVIHALATTANGAPLENPRQVPAYSYSKRYGPRPPCFARATVLADTPGVKGGWLLVGGTASILGEDSIHVRDAERQAMETFANLSKLVASANTARGGHVDASESSASTSSPATDTSPDATSDNTDTTDAENAWLARFSHLRVYIVRASDAETLRELVLERFTHCVDIEFAQADLCRQELLVEIEGLARLD